LTWEKPGQGESYLAGATPFSLPLAIRRVRCTFAEPLPAALVAHNPTSSLLGAILDQVLTLATKRGVDTTWLFKPHSETLKRDFPSPVAWSLEDHGATSFTGLFVLWGRHATAAAELAWSSVESASRHGLTLEGRARPFSLEASPWFRGTVAEWLDRLPSPEDAIGVATSAACQRDLPALCADAVVQILYWDLADSGLAESLVRDNADRIAESLRREIRHGFCCLHVDEDTAAPQLGRRYSRTNRGAFDVSRWDGEHLVRASAREDLLVVWPWIALMTLRGPGPRKRFGVSEARAYLPAEVDRLPSPFMPVR